jgi:mono/diheme cytochrome c family protein
MNRFLLCLGGLLLFTAFGCEPAPVPKWSMSNPLQDLEDNEAKERISKELVATFGQPLTPTYPSATDDDREHLRQGAAVYTKRCVQCHGVSGDGAGVAADYLKPRPRDYRNGIFKFTSTPYGERPRREDLVRTLKQGIVGTSMPSFALLPPTELNAVADYVIYLAKRGETELLIAAYTAGEEDMSVADVVAEVNTSWANSANVVVRPLTIMPAMTEETIELGRQAFLTEGCSKCHGPDGRGKTQDNVGTDVWGHPTNAADITAGMLHGGQRPIDIYRRISSGINGTPMPSFRAVFDPEGKDPADAKNPDTMWHLVHYVMHVANHRRSTLPPPPSLTAPEAETNKAEPVQSSSSSSDAAPVAEETE